MSHFAELDANNVVLRVVVCDNDDPNGDEGHQWLLDNLGGTWIQTSYNSNFRNKYAAIGDTYDASNDVFIEKQPFASWILDSATYFWHPPIPKPIDGKDYMWDEPSLSWVLIVQKV